MSWHDQAVCKGEDIHLFFPQPSGKGYPSLFTSHEAKKLCARCPVRSECFNAGEEDGRIVEGIWGGYTYEERYAMKHGRRPHRRRVVA